MTTKPARTCPRCGEIMESYRNPLPTADIIIELAGKGIILIMRKNEPRGWAIPGGFVDYGESLEDAAIREAKEETGLDVALTGQLHTYSKPDRDPRHHTITTVYTATASGTPVAADGPGSRRLLGSAPGLLGSGHGKYLIIQLQTSQG